MSTYTPELKSIYREKIIPEMMKSKGYKNVHQVPVLEKIVLNTGFGAATDKGTLEAIVRDMTLIAGQKAVITKAKSSISNFKLREGMPVGCKVTLRGNKMYDFLYRLLVVALPAIRDFRGIGTKLDGRGNYNLGITDHTIFPEINVDGRNINIGMDIAICTTAETDAEGLELLKLLGLPFRRKDNTAV